MAFGHAQNVVLNGCELNETRNETIIGPINFNTHKHETGLQVLQKAIALGAAYDSKERDPPSRCHPGTRVELLNDLEEWFDARSEREGRRVLWLHGPAGSGKSAIAQTACERYANSGDLAASFFFSRGRQDRGTGIHLFTTIAFQLALSIPEFRKRVITIVDHDPLITHRSTRIQVDQLIIEPFVLIGSNNAISASDDNLKLPTLVVIDGLDECQGDESQSLILEMVLHLIQQPAVPLRFLILSRPEPPIRYTMEELPLKAQSTTLSLYGDYHSRKDVLAYLRTEFRRIRHSSKHRISMADEDESWPGNQVTYTVADKADGYFIFVSTLIKFVDDDMFESPADRLQRILEENFSGPEPFAALDKLYLQILSTHPNSDFLKRILGHFLAASTYSIFACLRECYWELYLHAMVLGVKVSKIEMAIQGLHSILEINTDKRYYVTPIHKSFEDFLYDVNRAGKWFIDWDLNIERFYQNVHALVMSVQDMRNDRVNMTVAFPELLYFLTEYSERLRHYSELHRVMSALRDMGTEPWILFLEFVYGHPSVTVHNKTAFVSLLVRNVFVKENPDNDLKQKFRDFRDATYRYFVPVRTKRGAIIIQSLCRSQTNPVAFTKLLQVGLHEDAIADVDPFLQSALNFCFALEPKGLWERNHLHDLLQDAERCGNLFVAQSDVTRFLAERCLNMVTRDTLDNTHFGAEDGNGNFYADLERENAHLYARKHWVDYLVEVATVDEPLLELLRQASKSYVPDTQFFSHIALHWPPWKHDNYEKLAASLGLLCKPCRYWPQHRRSSCRLIRSPRECQEFLRWQDSKKIHSILRWLQNLERQPRDLIEVWEKHLLDLTSGHSIYAIHLNIWPYNAALPPHCAWGSQQDFENDEDYHAYMACRCIGVMVSVKWGDFAQAKMTKTDMDSCVYARQSWAYHVVKANPSFASSLYLRKLLETVNKQYLFDGKYFVFELKNGLLPLDSYVGLKDLYPAPNSAIPFQRAMRMRDLENARSIVTWLEQGRKRPGQPGTVDNLDKYVHNVIQKWRHYLAELSGVDSMATSPITLEVI